MNEGPSTGSPDHPHERGGIWRGLRTLQQPEVPNPEDDGEDGSEGDKRRHREVSQLFHSGFPLRHALHGGC